MRNRSSAAATPHASSRIRANRRTFKKAGKGRLNLLAIVPNGKRSRLPPLKAKSFSEGWALGYHYIYTVQLVDWAIQRCDRYRAKFCWPVVVAAIAAWPFWLNLALLVLQPPWAVTSSVGLLWLSGFTVLDVLTFFSAWCAWTFANQRSKRIDQMLQDTTDREAIGQWIASRLARRRQMILPVVIVAASVNFLYWRHDQLSTSMGIDVSLASYLCVAWTFLLAGIDVYWLYTAPTLTRLFYHCRSLKLRWQDPASTPGIELLADGFGVSALFLLLAAGVVVGIAFWLPGGDAAVLDTALDGFFVLLAILCFRVGLYTYAWIYATVKREKRRTLDRIERSMPSAGKLATEVVVNQASLYRTISGAPELPFSTGAVVQYTATLLGVITAFVIQQVNGP